MGKKRDRRERRELLTLLNNLTVVRITMPGPNVSGHPTYEYALRTTQTDMTSWMPLSEGRRWIDP